MGCQPELRAMSHGGSHGGQRSCRWCPLLLPDLVAVHDEGLQVLLEAFNIPQQLQIRLTCSICQQMAGKCRPAQPLGGVSQTSTVSVMISIAWWTKQVCGCSDRALRAMPTRASRRGKQRSVLVPRPRSCQEHTTRTWHDGMHCHCE